MVDATQQKVQEFSPEGEYLSEFGNGVLNTPVSIAIDSEDRIWVADQGLVRILEFNKAGELLSEFGEEGGGELGTIYYGLNSIAVDSKDHIWISDDFFVQEFNPTGEYLGGFEATVLDIEIDSEDSIWAAGYDYDSHLYKYSPEGELLVKVGGKGSAAGQFEGPGGIAIDSGDYVWVTDRGNDRVQRFAREGIWLGEVGEEGSGLGQFQEPIAIAADSEGYLWIGDSGNDRVQAWGFPQLPLQPKVTTEAATGVKSDHDPEATLSGTINPNGTATSYHFEYGKTTAYGTSIPVSPKALGSGSEPVAVSEKIQSLQDGTTYHYRLVATRGEVAFKGQDKTFKTPTMPGLLGVGVEKVLSAEATVRAEITPKGKSTSYWFEYGTTEALGSKIPVSPESIGSCACSVKVTETLTGLTGGASYYWRLVATNPEGSNYYDGYGPFTTYSALPSYTLAVGSKGTSNGKFEAPNDVAVDPYTHYVYVLDTNNNRVQVFNKEGEYLSKFGSAGSGNGQFSSPQGIAADTTSNPWGPSDIYVADTGNNRIQKFNASGEYLSKFGSAGSGNGQFSSPAALAVGKEGIAVADTGNNRIQRFNSKGEYVSKFGSKGTGNGQLESPHGLSFNPAGTFLWVADTGNNRIQVFSFLGGSYDSQFGSKGSGNGQFESPWDVIRDPQEAVWVLDAGNRRVQKFTKLKEYLGQIGSKGSGAGQFETPRGFALLGMGDLWVADAALHRVQKW